MKYLEMESLFLIIPPASKYKLQFGEDEGFGFILRGKLEVELEGETKRMNRGDCFNIFFDNQLRVQNGSNKLAEILLVNH